MSESKTDVIDFIINVLREHEESLDSSVTRLNSALENITIECLSYDQAKNVLKSHIKALQELTKDLIKVENSIEKFVKDIYNLNIIQENWIDSLIEYGVKNCLIVEMK